MGRFSIFHSLRPEFSMRNESKVKNKNLFQTTVRLRSQFPMQNQIHEKIFRNILMKLT